MIAIKKILCPVDGSEFSNRALRHAAALASWYEAELTALSVRSRIVPTGPWLEGPVAPVLAEDDPQAGREHVGAFVASAVGRFPTRIAIRGGAVVSEILSEADEIQADLIVMGTHGVSGFERLLLGSVTEKVLRKAKCPVLTVPRAVKPDALEAVTFKTIVCGVDFSASSARALEYALSLAQEAGGRIVLVHALEWLPEPVRTVSGNFDVPEYRRQIEADTRKDLEALVPEDARAWCDPEFVLMHGKAYRGLVDVAEARDAELIVLGTQGRGALDRALFGSTADHVVREATAPVLVVPAGADAEGSRSAA
jgi:nucleotide-binding universal stress UspA family protein